MRNKEIVEHVGAAILTFALVAMCVFILAVLG
jgi:hypothetical protein